MVQLSLSHREWRPYKIMLKKIIYFLFLSIGSLFLAGLLFVNRLAYQRGGLNHHLLYRKHQYLKGIFSPQNLLFYSIVLTVVTILMLFVLFRKGNVRQKIAQGFAVFYCITFILCSHLGIVRQLIVYPYLLMSLLLCFFASLLAIFFAGTKNG